MSFYRSPPSLRAVVAAVCRLLVGAKVSIAEFFPRPTRISVEFMSEARAITNLIGNGVATLVVSRSEGAFDDAKRAVAEGTA